MEKRLKALLYNAISYMLEDLVNNQTDWNDQDVVDEICDYLGASEEELRELGILEYEVRDEED